MLNTPRRCTLSDGPGDQDLNLVSMRHMLIELIV